VLDEAVAVLDAVGSERARAETFVGLVVAAYRRGAPGPDLMEVLDAGWPRLETALSGAALVLLLPSLTEPLAADGRRAARFVCFLAGEDSAALRGAIFTLCDRFLDRGGRFTDHESDRIAAALCRGRPASLNSEPAPRALLGHLWDWALGRRRADI